MLYTGNKRQGGWLRQALAGAVLLTLLVSFPMGEALAAEKATANGHVYFRKGPSTSSDILIVLAPNAELKLIGKEGEWYQAQYGKKTGYVREDVITLVGQPSANTTAAASSPTSGTYRQLKAGMSGDDVFALEEALAMSGYFDLMPDKKYDDHTKEAVKAYQKANGLTADGIAGVKTQEKLLGTISGDAEDGEAAGAQAIINVPESTTTSSGLLKEGVKGDEVRTLQQNLQTLKHYTGTVTGNFGPLTGQAVRSFQKANRLTADGVAGPSTLGAISSALSGSGSSSSSSSSAAADTGSGLLKEGSQGDAVLKMQTALKQLKYYTGSLTGNFGTLTGQAVRAFQRANGLTADGIAGNSTLSKLYGGATANNSATANSGSGSGSSSGSNASAGSVSAGSVIYANWYETIRPKYKNGTVVSIYDFHTGLTWRCRFMSVGKHADSEPMTSDDTNTMYRAFGNKNTWTAKSVWITMPDGKTYIGSLHNVPHLSGNIKDNNFDGHLCIHFPREMKEAEETGPYAVSHQNEILKGWEETQRMAGK